MNKILIIFLVIISLQVNGQEVFTNVDEMPYFEGCSNLDDEKEKRDCSNNALISFISQNLKYPKAAREEGVEGTIYTKFVVNKDGSIDQIKVLNFIGEGFEAEVVKVIEAMPMWEAGQKNGNKVDVELRLPIKFALNKGKYDDSQNFSVIWGDIAEPSVSKKALKKYLSEKLIIRDELGNERSISELSFIFEKGNNYREAKSKGHIHKRMKKVVKKSKRGGVFSIKIIISDGDAFKEIKKNYKIK